MVGDIHVPRLADRNAVRLGQAFRNARVWLCRAFLVLGDVLATDVRYPKISVAIDRAECRGIDTFLNNPGRLRLTGGKLRNPARPGRFVDDVERPITIDVVARRAIHVSRNNFYWAGVFAVRTIHLNSRRANVVNAEPWPEAAFEIGTGVLRWS